MIKKLVSNALLSLVMDKNARDKLNAFQDQKRALHSKTASNPDTLSGSDNIELAYQLLENEHTKKPLSTTRQALLARAISIHQEKSYVLDGLTKSDRDKLASIAIKLLDRNNGEQF